LQGKTGMYVPHKLHKNFIIQKETNKDNIIIKGRLSCCDNYCFSVSYFGKLKTGLLCRVAIYPQEDVLALNAKCHVCNNEIHVFNSITDGYDGCFNTGSSLSLSGFNELYCPKCTKTGFSIALSFEYQSKEELIEDGIQDYGNAFSWIWISPTCLSCGKIYKNIVDMETA